MENIELKEDKGNLVFIDKQENSQVVYSIPVQDLGAIRISNLERTSEWVSQLNETSWAYPELLYRLAKIIQDRFSENNIDWEKTFLQVEKKDYLEKYGDIINEFDNSFISPIDELFTRIVQGRQENVSEVNDTLSGIVKKNLQQYLII